MPATPDLPALLQSIRESPDDRPRWLALAGWFWENGRDDEAIAVRTFWPVLRDNLAHATLDETLDDLRRNALLLGTRGRKVEALGDGVA